jgi:hypothetical protein
MLYAQLSYLESCLAANHSIATITPTPATRHTSTVAMRTPRPGTPSHAHANRTALTPPVPAGTPAASQPPPPVMPVRGMAETVADPPARHEAGGRTRPAGRDQLSAQGTAAAAAKTAATAAVAKTDAAVAVAKTAATAAIVNTDATVVKTAAARAPASATASAMASKSSAQVAPVVLSSGDTGPGMAKAKVGDSDAAVASRETRIARAS